MQVSNEYTLDPKIVKFDNKYVVFNPLQSELEYKATLDNIARVGQRDPILMLDGVCVDGRHRTKIAIELGIPVKCVDVDGSSVEEIIVLCNQNTMSGRDYDNSQKAIQALRLVTEYSMTAVEAARLMKVDKRMVSYAATIRGFNREDVLDTLLKSKDSKVKLDSMERPSRSLELLAKFIKAEAEEKSIVVDDSERIQWEADSYIKTELGKAWYYSVIEEVELAGKVRMQMLLAEMANMKFKVDTNE